MDRDDREEVGNRDTYTPEPTDFGPQDDPIVAEVRAVREALFAEAGNDLDEFVRRVRDAQSHSTHAVVTLPPKPADTAA